MHYLEILSTGISVISLIIVIYGAIIAFCAFIRNESRRFTGKYSFTATRELRADLGTYLLLGLEFLIASDILKTVLEPSLNELAILGGVVILRTILSIFLNKEIKELQVQKEGTGGPEKDLSNVWTPPPFTNNTCPVIQLEIGAAKKRTAPAISSTSPNRLIGVCSNIFFSISGVSTDASACVSTAPGPTALIRTSGPKSIARLAVM